MRKFWERLRANTGGATTLTLCLSAPIMIASLGLGIDTSVNYFAQERLQNAADQAAMSIARAIVANSAADLQDEAEFIAYKAGFDVLNGSTVVVNNPPTSGPNIGSANYLEVRITSQQAQFFSAIFGDQPRTITGRAVAKYSQGESTCLLALNATKDKAVNISGGVTINLNNCDAQINSTSSKALAASGGAIMNVESAMIAGNTNLSGGSVVNASGSLVTNAPTAPDPLASVAMPAPGTCTATNFSTATKVTLYPGTYCGGITVSSGGDVYLESGTYIIDGGKLVVSGGGILIGDDVTLVFTSRTGANYPTVAISGSSILELTAPKSGPLSGIAMFSDRNTTVGTKFDFSGGSGQMIDGVLYAPRNFLNWSGGSSVNTNCTTLIGNTFNFSGSAALTTSDCGKYGIFVGEAAVVLAE